MNRFLVGMASEIPEGSKKIIQAEGRSVGIYNIEGQYYALRNTCPHQGAELCSGITASYITSNGPGDFAYEREGELVRCPWHQWEFDIKTGCMITDPKMRTKTYDVTVERYDVSVEENQLYVHI
ncbi:MULTISPECIES: Rieske (2Fe-2S) protein [unclassified Paenibacillus]|uniref:Rieske (2Fe-2S) protein n=1 Tax=unclassified Paenibacillus TaxID=185978 RepID=UPI001AEA42F6|nr:MULTISPECIES: Rieske (2Fe-2S) protein [unclassified Paenibacillus]MBP1153612.1 3-phenylpropionate/trans-cinnamate dioxygenase ferredoxin subunit [Paenibacillus sp. PvP091]MBP1171003.1 3-phenylpropionate/trans-cinnamate dioxygenase ferredoxin subunit [Paenibacillus sp. PvR098]MBP2442031.1 3-phenylpropionate/trans-cinnamate dioxygenase ferredoxin subunit [Paenibacillus sp. PvP052]